MAPAGSIPPTLRDESLEEEADQLKKLYLGKALTQVEVARSTMATLTVKVMSIKNELEDNRLQLNDMWWTTLIQWSSDTRKSEKLVQDLKDKMTEENDSIVYAIFNSIPIDSNKN
jgi:E3 ubiquitin-protein ligase SHPRH